MHFARPVCLSDWEAIAATMSDEARRAVRSVPRKPTNVTLREPLLQEARDLGVRLSQACERGLREVVEETRTAKWRRDNHDAIEAWNEYVEKNGLPLSEYRQF
jgi:antitoxin CcdA